ncbi:transglycosylase domain-containing protein [Microbacterium sp. LWH10-1.2]|uniref:transglycosylase domain-containing protein n=1 Tax=unclassified Microbacterium TaxID=2609290 RepID=UPI003138BCFA
MPQQNRTVKSVLGGLLGLVGLSVVAGLLVTASATPVLAMTGITGSKALTLFEDLPENLKVNAPMEQSTIYATGTDGAPFALASFYEQNRVPVTYDQIAPVMFDAILSSEDKNFYNHGGVNLGATIKAAFGNVVGSTDRGASTITQQYVKNVQIQECEQKVDPAATDYQDQVQQCWLNYAVASGSEGIERKLREMRYALQIEKDYSKNDILLGYLNISSFGGQVYGIEAAANRYFSKSAANLTVAEAATIAGMVQEPNTLRIDIPAGTYTTKSDGVAHNSEADGYKDTLTRRNYVLERMLIDGKITKAQYDEAYATPITPAIKTTTQGCGTAGSNAYFCQYVKSIIESDPAFGDSPEDRRANLRRGGMQIYTTLDMRIQGPAAEAMAANVPPNFDNQYLGAAGISVEVGTGRVLALTQNTTFSETIQGDQAYSSLVYATDKAHGGSNGFSVGSTYKLFTLIDWLEQGHSVRESVNGTNRLFTKMKCDGSPVPFGSKKIGNSGNVSGGPGTPLSFTAASLNSGFLAMAEKLDLCDINKVADRMGVTLANGGKTTDENVPYDVLGSKYISPLAMAGAYATVASGGTYCTPRAIDRIVDAEGKEMTLPSSTCTPGTITPEVAATAAFALQGPMRSGGTGTAGNPNDGTPLIGKTGTHETWGTMMIESSTKVTTAVWVGRSDGQANITRASYNGTTLNRLRFPIARAMQGAANAVYHGDAFPKPDDKLTRQVQSDIPNVVGKSIEEATAILDEAGFTVSVGAAVDSDLPANVVAAQNPSGQAATGTPITLSPSNGQGATVPAAVIGQSRSDAQNTLFGAGFSAVAFDNSCNPPNAKVTSTNPAAGTAANKSATIQVSCQ